MFWMLMKSTVDTAFNVELTDHLRHENNVPKTSTQHSQSLRSKMLRSDDVEFELNTPRDRENTCEPQLMRKTRRVLRQPDSQILPLYGKSMPTREIAAAFKEAYEADVLLMLISKVTDAVKEHVAEW
jgi:putative transposase